MAVVGSEQVQVPVGNYACWSGSTIAAPITVGTFLTFNRVQATVDKKDINCLSCSIQRHCTHAQYLSSTLPRTISLCHNINNLTTRHKFKFFDTSPPLPCDMSLPFLTIRRRTFEDTSTEKGCCSPSEVNGVHSSKETAPLEPSALQQHTHTHTVRTTNTHPSMAGQPPTQKHTQGHQWQAPPTLNKHTRRRAQLRPGHATTHPTATTSTEATPPLPLDSDLPFP